MRRRGFLGAVIGAALAGLAVAAPAHRYPFDEAALMQGGRITFLARCAWDQHWWEFYRIEADGREEWVGALTEEHLAETGRTVDDELRMLAGI